MRVFLLLSLFTLSGLAWGEACVVHSQAERLDVKVCQ
ncbi:MAG: NADH:ubiquinone oxidoreductase, partial [Pseudomonas sp.]|nr:NADH:ubiquinone oxidoreductase [Pseudomonas sp.]